MRIKKPGKLFPDRKISETFLDFASPLLAQIPPRADGAEIERVLTFVVTVWNAMVFDKVEGHNYYIGKLINGLSDKPALLATALEYFQRKEQLFGDDFRLIGNYKVTRKADEINLWAEARDPFSTEESNGRTNRIQELSLDSQGAELSRPEGERD